MTSLQRHVYDASGEVIERFIRVDDSFKSIDKYDLDDPEVEWTPLDDTGYEVNQRRECRVVETEEKGHVWVLLNEKMVCMYSLSVGHEGQCHGERTCCRECGELWKMYPQHEGKCWTCIAKGREKGLSVKCSRVMGVCKNSKECLPCFRRSFANHEKSLFWGEENGVRPEEVATKSHKRFILRCSDCKHDINPKLRCVASGHWCKYCTNKERCDSEECQHCYDNSFASHPRSKDWHPTKNGETTPRQVALNDHCRYWFHCCNCKHDINPILSNIANEQWCKYCVNKRRCDAEECQYCYDNSFASHPRSKNWHPFKNESITSRQVALNDNKKYWFHCPDCKHDINPSLDKIASGKWCKYCKNKTEKKLFDWLLTIPSLLNPQHGVSFDWCRNHSTNRHLPFDFYIKSLRLIIELDGVQHWLQVSNWNTPESTQATDLYKMTRAQEQGLTVIRICQEDVLYDRYDWKTALLPHLYLHEQPTRILLDNDTGIYERIEYLLEKSRDVIE